MEASQGREAPTVSAPELWPQPWPGRPDFGTGPGGPTALKGSVPESRPHPWGKVRSAPFEQPQAAMQQRESWGVKSRDEPLCSFLVFGFLMENRCHLFYLLYTYALACNPHGLISCWKERGASRGQFRAELQLFSTSC